MTATQFCPPMPVRAVTLADRQKVQAAQRATVVRLAHGWLRTPYAHRCRVPGVGVDCVRLAADVYARAGVVRVTLEDMPRYSEDWYLHRSDEMLATHLAKYCAGVAIGREQPGDLVGFRFGRAMSHLGIVTGPGTMIHALAGRMVTEEAYGQHTAFAPRLAGVWTPRRWVEGALA